MAEITRSPLFGIVLSIFAYEAGVWINRKARTPLANPLFLAVALVIGFLALLGIPIENYRRGGDIISMFLAPATACLALSIYSQFDVLKKNLLPILAGTAVGSLVSMSSVLLLCRLFRLDERLTASLLPKSVTTPIAIEIARQHGGIIPVTVAVVIVTGVLGAILSPYLIKLLRVNNPVAAGIAIGTSSHALGTTKAVELGEVEGAMSGIAIGVSGLMTVCFSMLIR